MMKNISVKPNSVLSNKVTHIPQEYGKEFTTEILKLNINREIILSLFLITIDISLIIVDLTASHMWTRDTHVFNKFSKCHFSLLIIPLFFLLLVKLQKRKIHECITYNKILHIGLNVLVLTLCSQIAVMNILANKLPYPYLVAMFCISSVILLDKAERIFIFMFSYFFYIVGIIRVQPDTYKLAESFFFFTLMIIMAIVISGINYNSYLNIFINNKIISHNNKALDSLYKVTEETLKKKTEELNEAVAYEKVRASFFANISHELRTPLTVIFSAEQMLSLLIEKSQQREEHKNAKQYTNIIRQNCYRLIRLVANLIDITKIDAGYFQVYLQNCDIIKIVEDITLSVAKHIESRDLTLIFDTDIEELAIACDPDKIERIMLNLLSNAVKFTPRGGIIYVNVFDKEDSIHIHVKDTGIGIPSKMKDSVFERFVQVDKTTSRSTEGSGIGLSLVKSLVHLHHGSIELISEEGKGSEFIIILPKTKTLSGNFHTPHELITENKNVEKISIEFSDIYDL
jgi:two-component system, OmpR family, phosphate regulon sensor histidine kinase PhoR